MTRFRVRARGCKGEVVTSPWMDRAAAEQELRRYLGGAWPAVELEPEIRCYACDEPAAGLAWQWENGAPEARPACDRRHAWSLDAWGDGFRARVPEHLKHLIPGA